MTADLLIVALAGFVASLVDGALGMGFGPTSASILLSAGVSPGAVSASINVAKVVTGIVGGLSHWRLGNVDRRLVVRLALPGCAGAVVGSTILATVDADRVRPVLAVLLILIGLRILLRFSSPISTPKGPDDEAAKQAQATRGIEIAGAVGGTTNGLVGAWGPVVTPYLMHRGIAPRISVGCVNTAEVAVAVVSVGSLVTTMGSDGFRFGVVVAMLAGGVVAAPFAAYAVRLFRPRLLGLAVAALLLLTQSRELATTVDLPGSRWLAYLSIPVAVVIAAARPPLLRRQRRRAANAAAL